MNSRRVMMAALVLGALVSACGSNPVGGGGSTTNSVRFENDSSATIFYFYVSPSSSSTWGSDQLGANVLAPGQSFTLTGLVCNIDYDYKGEDSSHTELGEARNQFIPCGAPQVVRIN